MQNVENILSKSWSYFREGKLVSLDINGFIDKDEKLLGIWIARIYVQVSIRKKGYATEAMKNLLHAADIEQVDCYLTINAYGDMSYEQLEKWYRSLGFENDSEGLFRRKCK